MLTMENKKVYVEIHKNLTSDEIILLDFFSKARVCKENDLEIKKLDSCDKFINLIKGFNNEKYAKITKNEITENISELKSLIKSLHDKKLIKECDINKMMRMYLMDGQLSGLGIEFINYKYGSH